MTQATSTTEALAADALGWFEVAARGEDEGESYWRQVDEAPEWIGELCREAHGPDLLPDDWRYAAIVATLEAISEGAEDGHEFADAQVDPYSSERYAWLASHWTRHGYIEAARDEGLIDPRASVFDQIGIGQYCEALEVFASVRDSLEARLDEVAELA